MSIITSLTRMWLTRSTKPFIFKNEYDNVLSYQDCDNLGLYVHAKVDEGIVVLYMTEWYLCVPADTAISD